MEEERWGQRKPLSDDDDEGTILRYEERITEMLLAIALCHGQVERLEEKAREEDKGSDFYSEYTASLPCCPLPFPSPAAIHTLDPPLSPEESGPDLFLAVHETITSLEKTVFSHRKCTPSVEGHVQAFEGLEESLRKTQQVSPELLRDRFHPKPTISSLGLLGFLEGNTSIYEKEIALYTERNAALWLQLTSRNEALQKAKTTLGAYQEERVKLQKKVKELQKSLSDAETLADGPSRDLWALQASPRILPMESSTSEENPVQTPETQTEQLQRSIEQLQGLNQLLAGALQETKNETERLSLMLSRRESDHTALRLAARYSEDCLEAYEVLLWINLADWGLPMLGGTREEGDRPHTGPHETPSEEVKSAVMDRARQALHDCATDMESQRNRGGICCGKRGPEVCDTIGHEKQVLYDYIRHLRGSQAALKLSPPSPASAAAQIKVSIKAMAVVVQKALRDALPAMDGHPKPEKAQLMREIQAAQVGEGIGIGTWPEDERQVLTPMPLPSKPLEGLKRTLRHCTGGLASPRDVSTWPGDERQKALGDLNAGLHLAQKERRMMELQLYTHRAQEEALRLAVQIRTEEHDELGDQGDPSSSSSSSSNSEDYGPVFCGAKKSVSDSEAQRQKLGLPHLLARNKELKDQIQFLLTDLEESSRESKAQEIQQVEFTLGFFQAHSALVLAYRNACRKQDDQVQRLETQMGFMGQCQARQLDMLRRTLERLEAEMRHPVGWVGVSLNDQPS